MRRGSRTTIGIAGGGQLGRMLTEAAHKLGHKVVILDATPNSPAGQIAGEQIVGNYKDAAMIRRLAAKSDVLTYEIESVNAEALAKLSSKRITIHPAPETLLIIRDKFLQKRHLRRHKIVVTDYGTLQEAKKWRYPFILKTKSGGFDGRGNRLVRNNAELQKAIREFGTNIYAEKIVSFSKELAVVAARTVKGEMLAYTLTETIHKDHICHMTLTPAEVSPAVAKKAYVVARKVLKSFKGAGVFGIEMFLVGNEILVNEIAPRVHNSGHWTIEGAETSQFEQHVRAITGLPLGSVKMNSPAVVMINILGNRNGPAKPRGLMKSGKVAGVKVHMYGKMETRMQRKMGHLSAVADTLKYAKANALKAKAMISI